MPSRMFGGGLETLLLHRRHHAAPGMFLVSRNSAGCSLGWARVVVRPLGGSSANSELVREEDWRKSKKLTKV